MTSSFSALKQARSSSFDKLNSQLQKMGTSQTSNSDDNFWKLEVDKAQNGYAVIRFLPAPKGEDMPFVRKWDHGFQGPGGWYIEDSLTTLGQDDPVSEYNSQLWNSGIEANKDIARKQKRRLSFIANIYVVKDPANPQNEGRVMQYKFGKKIFDMLNDVMNPQFPDEAPINPFDFWEGANFNLKARSVEGYRNYDKSDFSAPGALTKPDGSGMSDDEFEAIWESQGSLAEFVDPKNFKSYNELKAKMYKVLGLDGSASAPTTTAEDDEPEMDFTPKFKEQSAPAMAETAPAQTSSSSDDEFDLSFFNELAKD